MRRAYITGRINQNSHYYYTYITIMNRKSFLNIGIYYLIFIYFLHNSSCLNIISIILSFVEIYSIHLHHYPNQKQHFICFNYWLYASTVSPALRIEIHISTLMNTTENKSTSRTTKTVHFFLILPSSHKTFCLCHKIARREKILSKNHPFCMTFSKNQLYHYHY